MREPKTHFEQIPVEIVKQIATELPAKEFPADDASDDIAVNIDTEPKATSPEERWRVVAEKVQNEADPQKMLGLIEQLIATFDDEQVRKRVPHTRDAQRHSGNSSGDQL